MPKSNLLPQSPTPARLILPILLAIATLALHAQDPAAVLTSPSPPNAAATLAKPYVVLVSLDGFRADYPVKDNATHLLAIAAHGVSTQGMIPSYPSLTFPNHYTLATGLYPEHHGIVANSFYDATRDAHYSMSRTSAEGAWYGGTPIWALAEKQGVRSACFFWPGSEAEIAGVRPSYYLKFDDHYPEPERIDQVIAWLKLPEAQRPHLITLYYSDVDHAGHEYGPDAPETAAAVHHLDDLMGTLADKLHATGLPVDLIIVADHGMARTNPDWITLDKYADLSGFTTDGPLLYSNDEALKQKTYLALKAAAEKDPRFSVYRRKDMPAKLHDDANPRTGDPVVVPNGPYAIRAHAMGNRPPTTGSHGYDPSQVKEMRAIFFAEGPAFNPGVTLPPFENVDVYPLIAHILGLTPPPIDGTAAPFTPALKK
jgi:predicted AlkP superfamily pyrophosphatase or phosphodiesterase